MFSDWESRISLLFVVGGIVGILAGTFLPLSNGETVALAGGGFLTLGALALAMDLAAYRARYPYEVTLAGAVILAVELFVVIVLPGPGQDPSRFVMLFSPGAFAMGIILLLTGISVLWRRFKQAGSLGGQAR